MKPPTPEDLERWQALADAAEKAAAEPARIPIPLHAAQWELLCAARTAVPALLAEVARLREALEAIRDFDPCGCNCAGCAHADRVIDGALGVKP